MAERLTCVPRVREVWSPNPGQAESYTALQTVRHLNICESSCCCLDTMTRRWPSQTRYTLRRNTAIGECNEKFGFGLTFKEKSHVVRSKPVLL